MYGVDLVLRLATFDSLARGEADRMSAWRAGIVVAMGLLALGCGQPPSLRPAAPNVAGVSRAAFSETGGVHVTVAAADRSPRGLDPAVTPLWVSIHNGGEEPVWIGPGEVTLEGASGALYRAFPPEDVSVHPEAVARALPRVLLQPGTGAAGLLYFEPVPDGEARLVFRAKLRNAAQAAEVARVDLPLVH